MIYTPNKNPKQAFVVITIIVAAGILGGYFISEYFIAAALVFWIQYTAILSYLQFKRGVKYGYNNLTEWLLHPQVRFFTFEFLAIIGLASLILRYDKFIGGAALLIWWLFALNFYVYYRRNKADKYKPEKRFKD